MLCLREEVWESALVEFCLSDHTTLKEVFAGSIEGSVEEGEECNSIFAQDLLIEVSDRAGDIHAMEDRLCGSHVEYVSLALLM